MSTEKCVHCGHTFAPVWFQREDLGVRRARHEERCSRKTENERNHYRLHGRWPLLEPKRRQERSKSRAQKTDWRVGGVASPAAAKNARAQP